MSKRTNTQQDGPEPKRARRATNPWLTPLPLDNLHLIFSHMVENSEKDERDELLSNVAVVSKAFNYSTHEPSSLWQYVELSMLWGPEKITNVWEEAKERANQAPLIVFVSNIGAANATPFNKCPLDDPKIRISSLTLQLASEGAMQQVKQFVWHNQKQFETLALQVKKRNFGPAKFDWNDDILRNFPPIPALCVQDFNFNLGVESLGWIPLVESLKIDYNFHHLAEIEFPNLISLDITGAEESEDIIGDDDGPTINLANLRFLKVSCSEPIWFNRLSCPSLTTLALVGIGSESSISANFVKRHTKSLKTLQVAFMRDVRILRHLPQLQVLSLTTINDQIIAELDNLSGLEELSIHDPARTITSDMFNRIVLTTTPMPGPRLRVLNILTQGGPPALPWRASPHVPANLVEYSLNYNEDPCPRLNDPKCSKFMMTWSK